MAVGSARRVFARVTTPSGRVIGVPDGNRLVFGRGPDADVLISAGRGLSRRAGVITAMNNGAWVANISCTHALYTESDGYRIRLPRLEEPGDAQGGWFLRAGSVLVGSRAMLDEGQSLRVVVAGPSGVPVRTDPAPGRPGAGGPPDRAAPDGGPEAGGPREDGLDEGGPPDRDPPGDLTDLTDRMDLTGPIEADPEPARPRPADDATLLPLYLDPKTKLFLVALMWCRPWLIDPGRTTPLPRTPEIARAALEATDAYYELERFDNDPAFRDRLAARVSEHLKVLRRKITERQLVRPDVRLSDEVVVEVLIEHAIITSGDLASLDDPVWCSRQEDLWWTKRP